MNAYVDPKVIPGTGKIQMKLAHEIGVMLFKKCSCCRETKAITDFYRLPNYTKTKRVYYMAICKSCQIVKSKEYRKNGHYKQSKKKYAQSERGKAVQVKGTKKYNKTIRGKDMAKKRYRRFNSKPERKIYNQQRESLPKTKRVRATYRKSDRGRISIANCNHRRKLRINNTTIEQRITLDEWKEICVEFYNKCAYCGSGKNITIDHALPLSRGGLHHKSNILPACAFCNRSKGSRTINEWRPEICQIQNNI